jgi:hypothetical protein
MRRHRFTNEQLLNERDIPAKAALDNATNRAEFEAGITASFNELYSRIPDPDKLGEAGKVQIIRGRLSGSAFRPVVSVMDKTFEPVPESKIALRQRGKYGVEGKQGKSVRAFCYLRVFFTKLSKTQFVIDRAYLYHPFKDNKALQQENKDDGTDTLTTQLEPDKVVADFIVTNNAEIGGEKKLRSGRPDETFIAFLEYLLKDWNRDYRTALKDSKPNFRRRQIVPVQADELPAGLDELFDGGAKASPGADLTDVLDDTPEEGEGGGAAPLRSPLLPPLSPRTPRLPTPPPRESEAAAESWERPETPQQLKLDDELVKILKLLPVITESGELVEEGAAAEGPGPAKKSKVFDIEETLNIGAGSSVLDGTRSIVDAIEVVRPELPFTTDMTKHRFSDIFKVKDSTTPIIFKILKHSGSNGHVAKGTHGRGDVVVKVQTATHNEAQRLKALVGTMSDTCRLVKFRAFVRGEYIATVMEAMDGDCRKLTPAEMEDNGFTGLFLRQLYRCLEERKMTMTDMKLENIGYKSVRPGELEFRLLDLDAINDVVSTYPATTAYISFFKAGSKYREKHMPLQSNYAFHLVRLAAALEEDPRKRLLDVLHFTRFETTGQSFLPHEERILRLEELKSGIPPDSWPQLDRIIEMLENREHWRKGSTGNR